MLLPTMTAPSTPTLARSGRLVTRIPPPSLTPDHSITRSLRSHVGRRQLAGGSRPGPTPGPPQIAHQQADEEVMEAMNRHERGGTDCGGRGAEHELVLEAVGRRSRVGAHQEAEEERGIE